MNVYCFLDRFLVLAEDSKEAREFLQKKLSDDIFEDYYIESRRLTKKQIDNTYIINDEVYFETKRNLGDILRENIYFEPVLLADGNFIIN